jgi:hypothetical protein
MDLRRHETQFSQNPCPPLLACGGD